MPKSSLLTLINSCNRVDLAQKYFAQAAAYLPRDHSNGIFKVSDDFDYKSIMVYSSDSDMVPGSNRFPLLTTGGDRIYTGGHHDPRRAGLSPRDIERVKALYTPVGIPQQEVAPTPPAPPVSPGRQEKQVTKRWHSVAPNPGNLPGHTKAWPRLYCDADDTVIPYCYEDQASHDALSGLFFAGQARWAAAFVRAGPVFAADFACDINQGPCLCTARDISEVSVHIKLAQHGQTWPISTFGYRYPEIPKTDPHMPRHYILWPANAGKFNERGPLYMAHQIGEKYRRKDS